MLRDARLYFGATTVGSTSASASASVNATDWIDLEAHRTVLNRDSASTASTITPDIGENGMLEFNAKVTTAITSASSATLAIELYHYAGSSGAVAAVTSIISSGAVLYTTGDVTLATANKAAGATLVRVRVPAGTCQRFLAVKHNIKSGKLTAGVVQSWLAGPSETPK